MTKEELEKEAIKRVDAFIDNFSQDVRSTLYDRLNQEDVKDFLYSLYFDSAEPREKHIEELEEEVVRLRNEGLENINKYTRFAETDRRTIADLEKENAELKEKLQVLNLNGNIVVRELTKAKELLNEFLDFESSCMERGIYISDKIRSEVEQFLNNEVEK